MFKKVNNHIIVLATLLILCSTFQVKASKLVNFKNSNELLSVGSFLSIYEDKSGYLNLNDVLSKEFIPTKQNVPNLGISKSVFWLKLNIKNQSETENLMLKIASPIIDNIEFYYPENNYGYKSIRTGEALPFKTRKYQDPNYIFDITIPREKTITYYFKISSNEGIQIPISLGTKEIIFNQIKVIDILSGIYIGIMFVMIFYNLFIYFSVKDISYIYYVFYVFSVLLVQTGIQGYFFQYLWYDFPDFSRYSIFLFPSLVGVAGMTFMIVFLKVRYYSKILFKISFVFSTIYLIPLIAPFFKQYNIGYQILSINAGLVSIYIVFSAIYILKKGYHPAKYFLAAWVVFLVGVVIYILKDFEVLPFNNFTRYTMQIGSAIETILLSLALASRINLYKKERLKALEEKEKLILNQNIVLEKTVMERTLTLNKTLVDLKEAQSQLVDTEKMSSLGQLTAGIAHEINNPINFVSSNIPPLKQDLDDINTIIKKYEEITPNNIIEKLKEIEALKIELDFEYLKTELPTIIEGIEDGAKRTQEIVSGLRNFSRLDENDLQLANINEGINSTLILIQNKLNGIQLIKNLGTIPPIECYPGKLNQLFMNVIDNAIGAIATKKKEQPGELNISTYNDANFVYFKIKDNGIGMNATTKSKMFDPFYTTKAVGSGTGLGLSIVYTIVNKHNGEINVNTAEGIGTEITIKLPIKH
jgi:signal transduction histidine kinase